MINLKDKTILVVGGSGLIGGAITETLIQAGGFALLTCYSKRDGLPLDVTNEESINWMVNFIKDNCYTLDGLVYASGINRPKPFDQITLDDWQAVHEVNLEGAFRVSQALLPLIRDGGSVVFISSDSAFTGGPVSSHYAASKAGLNALSASLALFAAKRQIRVNTVCPGYVAGPMAEAGAVNEAVKRKINQTPLGRMVKPEEVAYLVTFLMSDLSRMITGQNLRVDGGLYF